ncbi:MAG: hypothetical protein K2X82_32045 [Gemmataceae bacterium]|nr:hypothetical protein [Gemmataceae bacterium]
MTDDLDDLLGPPPAPAGPDSALFRRTERVLRRGRLARRVARAGAVAAVFAAGGLAGWLAKPDRERVTTIEVAVASPPDVVTVPVVVPVPQPVPDLPQSSPPSPAAAELLAEQADDPAEAARLYRLAGDLYLNDRQDYRQAARCYRLHLARAGAAGLAPAADDSWLLTSLKNAKFKESIDATASGG